VEAVLEEFLDRCGRPCRILIALSGGGDSVGLLTALKALHARRGDRGLDLIAATVDHGLRSGSREEAIAAGRLSESLEVPHEILPWTGDKPNTGIQAAAREARYDLLCRHALSKSADIILTGHNLDDNVETYLMRRSRNAGIDGSGMAEAVLLFGKIWAARPLLALGRGEIRDYLRARATPWVDDPSNANPAFERVRLRMSEGRAPRPDFAELMRRRRARMQAAAHVLNDRAEIIGQKVAVMDLSGLAVADPAALDAIAALAAVIGGRDHPPGADGRKAIGRLLSEEHGQMTLVRVTFDKRGDRLYLQRESRNLPAIAVAPGATAIWDNRLHILNRSAGEISIGAADGEPLIDAATFDRLPARVRQLALRTGPLCHMRDRMPPQMSVFLPGYDEFLPLERLDLGNVLAKLMGLPHFPLPIFRHPA
jgi:tRNA(Ile)-lysidine synthase